MEPARERLPDPPASWQEHWFDHRQLLELYHADDDCAIYLDPDVRRRQVRWLPQYIGLVWRYSKATYGHAFGPDPRIYSIHHAGRHGGGHAGYYVSPVHDHHNVSDCGLDSWRESEPLAREGMVDSDYSRGCGIAPLVVEAAEQESAEIGDVSRRGIAAITDRLAFHFADLGLDGEAAGQLADAVMAGTEGALVTSRALRSPAPFDAVRAAMVSYARAATPKSAHRAKA